MKDNRWMLRIPKEYERVREDTTKAALKYGIPLGQYIAMALIHFNSAASEQSEH